jgi:Mn2+/Fe2+ NRAMP family transporter
VRCHGLGHGPRASSPEAPSKCDQHVAAATTRIEVAPTLRIREPACGGYDSIILSTAAPLHKSGETNIETAGQAAEALRPLAGDAAGVLFALGVIGVGFLAVPIMTTGAAYDLCQVRGWKSSLHAPPKPARHFYVATAGFTAVAIGLNFLGFSPMKALVWSGIIQGFSTPPLLLILLMTNDRALMGKRMNSR